MEWGGSCSLHCLELGDVAILDFFRFSQCHINYEDCVPVHFGCYDCIGDITFYRER